MTRPWRLYLAAFLPIVAVDRLSKALALAHLPVGVPRQVLGNALRFTLLYNRDAAMNLTLGPWSRWGFAAIATGAVVMILRVMQRTPVTARARALALGAVSAGAVGNLIDRIRWDRGVIDFIDAGIGTHRFWTFNVADIGVTLGAIALAIVLHSEDRAAGK